MFKTESRALTDAERLDGIKVVIERLKELSSDHVFLIEGKKDRAALNVLGISADMYQVQSGGGPANAAEYVEGHGGKCVVLTDWDRRGDSLAEQLVSILGRDSPDVVTDIRGELIHLCRSYIKDMESLDTFVCDLSAKVYEP